VPWLPQYFFDTDNTVEPSTCKIAVKEEDTYDNDRIERRWSLTEGGEGSREISWPIEQYSRWYYGGGDNRNCDLRIISTFWYPF